MSSRFVIVVAGLTILAIVVVVGGLFYLQPAEPDAPAISPEDKAAMFIKVCTKNLVGRGAMNLENSRNQVTAACKCLAEDFEEDVVALPIARFTGLLEFGQERPRRRAAALKCFRRVGLDFIPER